MEVRKANVMFGKAGGNASRNSYTCRISLPKTWVDRMGLNPECREVQIAFDGDRIAIQQPEGSPIKQAHLADNKRIRAFALVWEQMYRNHANIPFGFFEDMDFIGKGLADLGFVMDCGESVQTIVVPAGNSGSGEPIEQTIRVETPDGSTGADGMTLNVNVNVGEDGTPDQEAEASPQQQDGASWYQVAVLCLLSAILVCVIKKR